MAIQNPTTSNWGREVSLELIPFVASHVPWGRAILGLRGIRQFNWTLAFSGRAASLGAPVALQVILYHHHPGATKGSCPIGKRAAVGLVVCLKKGFSSGFS